MRRPDVDWIGIGIFLLFCFCAFAIAAFLAIFLF